MSFWFDAHTETFVMADGIRRRPPMNIHAFTNEYAAAVARGLCTCQNTRTIRLKGQPERVMHGWGCAVYADREVYPSRKTEHELAHVLTATGAKRSQVEHWARCGLLPDATSGCGTGNARKYSDADIAAIRQALAAAASYGSSAPKMVLSRIKNCRVSEVPL